jgi:hypothetical protein
LETQFSNNQLIKNKLYYKFEQLQTIFIESFSILLYCIYKYKKYMGSKISGIDNIAFTDLKQEKKKLIKKRLIGTRYSMSKKKINIKKDRPVISKLTKEDITKLKEYVKKKNKKIIDKLIKRFDVKNLKKNYKASPIKQIQISKIESSECRTLEIPILMERILQQIIFLTIHPMIEYKNDPHFFGFKTCRFPIQAISILLTSSTLLNKNNITTIPKRVSKEEFIKFSGKKLKLRKKDLTSCLYKKKNVSKKRKIYEYNY